MAIAGIPMRAASLNRSSSLAAPSSMENSVCVWRWTKLSPLLGLAIGVKSSLPARPAGAALARGGWGAGPSLGRTGHEPRGCPRLNPGPDSPPHAGDLLPNVLLPFTD